MKWTQRFIGKFCGAFHINVLRSKRVHHSSQEQMLQILSNAIDRSISIIKKYADMVKEGLNSIGSFSFGPLLEITPATHCALWNFISSPVFCNLEHVDGLSAANSFSRTIIPQLERLLLSLSNLFEAATDFLISVDPFNFSVQGLELEINDELGSRSWQESDGKVRIVDAELDADKDFKPAALGFFFWSNPLETKLPNAPDIEIYSMYGVGIPTERSYVYKLSPSADTCYIPFRIDTSADGGQAESCLKGGVYLTEGDETVPSLSAGFMCAKGWRGKTRFNPSGMSTYIREYLHAPPANILEGRGTQSGSHVDIMGNFALIEDIIRVAAGANGEDIGGDQVYSGILKWSEKIKLKL